MAAIHAIASMLKSGDHVVVSDNVYGGTFRLFERVLSRYQLTFTYVDTADLDATERAFTPATRLLFVETPSNPVMRLTDLRAAAALAHAAMPDSSSTTRSRARASSGRSSSAPTSLLTAPRNT